MAGKCAYCRRDLAVGIDVLGACQGVMGRARFIPFEDLVLFCSPKCVCRYFDSEHPRVPSRDP